MNRRIALFLIAASSVLLAAPRWTQSPAEPKRAKISIYQVAPGRHLDFLKWMAAREDAARAAGVPATQLYAHLDGDRWDYLVIWPITTPEQDKKVDDAVAAKGLKVGFPAALEFRELLTSHTDTYAEGPTTAAALVAAAK